MILTTFTNLMSVTKVQEARFQRLIRSAIWSVVSLLVNRSGCSVTRVGTSEYGQCGVRDRVIGGADQRKTQRLSVQN